MNLKLVLIKPTWDWGYFCGLVIGDGTLYRTRNNYSIQVGSTKTELVKAFRVCAKKLKLNPSRIYAWERRRKLPNGEIRNDVMYFCVMRSKIVYNLLRPCKLKDYRFKIPEFVFENVKALAGFLRGWFDAEGGIGDYVRASSKHGSNIEQIRKALERLGIRSTFGWYPATGFVVRICDCASIKLFAQLVGFGLARKRRKLSKLVWALRNSRPQRKYTEKEYQQVLELKQKGLNAKKISEVTGVPWATVKDWISGRTLPFSVRFSRYLDSISGFGR